MPDHATNVLAATINRSLQGAIQNRRNYLETREEQTVKNGTVQGFADITGAGEALVTIDFPISFLEKPVFGAGLELAENTWASDGALPLWSATVVRWTTQITGEVKMYTGALVGLVLFADVTSHSHLHYTFAAQAFTNPIGDVQSMVRSL